MDFFKSIKRYAEEPPPLAEVTCAKAWPAETDRVKRAAVSRSDDLVMIDLTL